MRRLLSNIFIGLSALLAALVKWGGLLMDLLDLPEFGKRWDGFWAKIGVDEFAIWLVAATVLLLVIVNVPWRHVRRDNRKTKSDGRGGSVLTAKQTLTHIIDHFGWDHGSGDAEERAELEFRDKARLNKVRVWGRPLAQQLEEVLGTKYPKKPIDPEYWDKAELDLVSIYSGEEMSRTTYLPRHTECSDAPVYDEVEISREDTEREWGTPQRGERVRRIRALYAQGVEVRNHAATLRVVDAATQNKMDEIREKLTKEMDEIVPEQAINLHTINTFEPSDHPPMILQDPKKTLIFSEFLLRIKKILEGYK